MRPPTACSWPARRRCGWRGPGSRRGAPTARDACCRPPSAPSWPWAWSRPTPAWRPSGSSPGPSKRGRRWARESSLSTRGGTGPSSDGRRGTVETVQGDHLGDHLDEEQIALVIRRATELDGEAPARPPGLDLELLEQAAVEA